MKSWMWSVVFGSLTVFGRAILSLKMRITPLKMMTLPHRFDILVTDDIKTNDIYDKEDCREQ